MGTLSGSLCCEEGLTHRLLIFWLQRLIATCFHVSCCVRLSPLCFSQGFLDFSIYWSAASQLSSCCFSSAQSVISQLYSPLSSSLLDLCEASLSSLSTKRRQNLMIMKEVMFLCRACESWDISLHFCDKLSWKHQDISILWHRCMWLCKVRGTRTPFVGVSWIEGS